MDSFGRSREMLKEATRLRTEHPQEAIEKIREAIRVCPEKVLEDHFKLSWYLAGVGQFDEAFAVLRRLATEESPRDYFSFNMNMGAIKGAMANVVFKEKKWANYVYYACSSAFHHCVALAAQGRYGEIASRVGENPLGERNGKKAFKELGIPESMDEFEAAFKRLLEPQLPKLKRLSELSPGSVGDMKVETEYVRLFDELSSSIFENAYKQLVQPILTARPNPYKAL